MLVWLGSVSSFVFIVSVGLAGVFLFVLVIKNGALKIPGGGIGIALLILAAGLGVLFGTLIDSELSSQRVFSACFGSIFSVPAAFLGARKVWEHINTRKF